MRTFKLTLEYDGTDFNGWQIQENANRTIQGEIEKVLSKIFKKKRVVLIGSGRTDKGVHAKGQVAHFRAETTLTIRQIQHALNDHLPYDVVVRDVCEVDEKFHAQFNAVSKKYSYAIINRSYPSALERKFSLFFPHRLNIALMRQEAKDFLGQHDFTSFANVNLSRKSDALRTIFSLDIKKKKDKIIITIEGDGFLYKMVRNIVGTLLAVGAGRLPKGSVKRILAQKDRRAAAMAVAPYGLCLEEVKY